MSTTFGGAGPRFRPRARSTAARTAPPAAPPVPALGPWTPATILTLQRAGGNTAVTSALRRAPIVHSPLTSPRFASDGKLQACAADRDRLRTGDRGESVVRVQQALTDLGYRVGGVDGKYGPLTAAAVRAFKADNRLGFEQFGDVGPGTMGRLDLLFAEPPRQVCPIDPPVSTAVQTDPAGPPGPADRPDGGCIDPPSPPGPQPTPPEPVPPEPTPPGPVPPEPTPPGPVPPEPTPPNPAPPPGPKFDRESAGCAITEPPTVPASVTPLPFTPDPTAALPATETPLPLDSIKDTAAFWGHDDARKLADEIAACYRTRAKDPKKQRTLADLTTDFDSVLQASFTRSQFGTPWWRLTDRLVRGLTTERATFKKKKPKATDQDVEAHMQEIRHKQREAVRQWDLTGTWGWMVERRDRLDFETLGAPGGVRVGTVPEILSPDQRSAAIHDRLAKLKAPLSEKEKTAALAKAAAAAGKPPDQLTPEEQQRALADAEEAKLKAMGKLNESAFKQARIDAEQAANNLVVPTSADFAGWISDPEKTPYTRGWSTSSRPSRRRSASSPPAPMAACPAITPAAASRAGSVRSTCIRRGPRWPPTSAGIRPSGLPKRSTMQRSQAVSPTRFCTTTTWSLANSTPGRTAGPAPRPDR